MEKTTKTTTTKKVVKWTPNDKQKDFLRALESAKEPKTLAEISEILGYELRTGTTNPLIAKGLVETSDTEIACLIVRADDTNKVVGKTTKKVKLYSLVKGASEN